MALETVRLGGLEVGRVTLGGNPFSGFSDQGPQRDREMRRYHMVARVKETMRQAERLDHPPGGDYSGRGVALQPRSAAARRRRAAIERP